MKKLIAGLASILAASAAFAFPGTGGGLSADAILAAAPTVAEKTLDELTVGERLAIAGALSVAKQKTAYVKRATAASFILPGAGQLMVGDYGAAALHLGAQAAILGGGATALWFLVPNDLKNFSLSRDQRRDLMHSYFTADKIGEILPAIGVCSGVAVLTLVNCVFASNGAQAKAKANIESGAVTFTPSLTMMGGKFGIGIGMGFAFH